jgi:acetoacetate decarboxylase
MEPERALKPISIMPVVGGPPFQIEDGATFLDQQSIALQYETDYRQAANILPACFKPTPSPLVTVTFAYNAGVEGIARRGYNYVAVSVSAAFDGDEEHIQGNYAVVVYENDTYAIIYGRELMGIPKLYADISTPKHQPDGRIRCEASLWGHMLFGIDVKADTNQPAEAIKELNANARGFLLGYKYVHRVDGPPDADYPLVTPSDAVYRQRWLGAEGTLFFGDPSTEDVGFNKDILDIVRSLTIKRILTVSRTLYSSTLRIDLTRKLQ